MAMRRPRGRAMSRVNPPAAHGVGLQAAAARVPHDARHRRGLLRRVRDGAGAPDGLARAPAGRRAGAAADGQGELPAGRGRGCPGSDAARTSPVPAATPGWWMTLPSRILAPTGWPGVPCSHPGAPRVLSGRPSRGRAVSEWPAAAGQRAGHGMGARPRGRGAHRRAGPSDLRLPRAGYGAPDSSRLGRVPERIPPLTKTRPR